MCIGRTPASLWSIVLLKHRQESRREVRSYSDLMTLTASALSPVSVEGSLSPVKGDVRGMERTLVSGGEVSTSHSRSDRKTAVAAATFWSTIPMPHLPLLRCLECQQPAR